MFYRDTCTVGAGALLNAIEEKLTANGWTLVASPLAYKRIYSSTGVLDNESIFICLDNTSADYLIIRTGDGFDEGSNDLEHPTTGRYLLLAQNTSTVYWLSVTADRIILATRCNRAAPNFYDVAYIGLPVKYKPLQVGAQIVFASDSQNTAKGLIHAASFATAAGKICFDHVGTANRDIAGVALNACFGANQLPNPVDGLMMFSPIVVGISGQALFGELNGVYSAQSAVVASEEEFEFSGRNFVIIISAAHAVAIEKI